jgi:putative transposase
MVSDPKPGLVLPAAIAAGQNQARLRIAIFFNASGARGLFVAEFDGRSLEELCEMPRRLPHFTGGLVFHVMNRGVRRMQLFDRPGDYDAFLKLVASAQRRTPVQCLAYCLMPNHFHFVLRPLADGDLARFMFWLTTVHAKRWHRAHGSASNGHVYQGRYKALPIAADGHFLRVCRYVERNPVRAGLVDRAEAWSWSSLAQHQGRSRELVLTEWPVERPTGWIDVVNEGAQTDEDQVRTAIRRSAPFGPEPWTILIANRLGIASRIRPGGRPRKTKPGLVFHGA